MRYPSFDDVAPLTKPSRPRACRRNAGYSQYLEALERRDLFSGAAPTVVSFGKTVGENAFFAFTATTFTPAFTDPDASDTLQAIKILTLPTHGTLTLTVNDVDTAVTAGQEIAATDILNLKYTPTTNFIGTDSLSWNGSDGTLFAITSATLTFNVTVPTITNFSKNVGQNSSVLFTLANFTGAYSGPNPLISIQITALPVHGTLTLVSDDTSTPVTLNQEISAVDVAKLTYTPAAGYTGSDTFKWTATDGHSTSAAATVTLAVKAPVVAALSQIVGQNVPFTFASKLAWGSVTESTTEPAAARCTTASTDLIDLRSCSEDRISAATISTSIPLKYALWPF